MMGVYEGVERVCRIVFRSSNRVPVVKGDEAAHCQRERGTTRLRSEDNEERRNRHKQHRTKTQD